MKFCVDKNITLYLYFSFSSMKHPHFCHLYLLVFTVMKKHSLVCVRIPCSLGSSAADKYIVCLLSGLPEYGGSKFLQHSILLLHCLVSVRKDTISVLVDGKRGHEMVGGGVWNIGFGSMISHTISTFKSQRCGDKGDKSTRISKQ
jgi:hypothetical protein